MHELSKLTESVLSLKQKHHTQNMQVKMQLSVNVTAAKIPTKTNDHKGPILTFSMYIFRKVLE